MTQRIEFFMTNKNSIFKVGQNGFTLIEALIALAVFSVGLLVVAQFHGSLMRTSGESKAASEALYMAQAEIDEMRSLEWGELDALITAGSETFERQGTNDTFSITREASIPPDTDRALVSVIVDGEALEPIQLHTWISRIANASLNQIDGDGTAGNYPLDEIPSDANRVDTVDGFLIRSNDTPEGREITEVIDPETGDFLQLPNGGARISGTVFFHSSSSTMNEAGTLQVSATGNSICRKFSGSNGTESQAATVPIDQGNYNAVGYTCIVSNGWLGSISARTPTPDKVCVGSPSLSRNEDVLPRGGPEALSNGPGAPTQRRYFGIGIGEEDNVFEIGIVGNIIEDKASIGTICPIGGDCESTTLEVLVPGGHHFLVADGSQNCQSAMRNFSEENVGHATLDADDPFNPNNPFYDNPAGLFCTTRPTCGLVTNTSTNFLTRMSGFAGTVSGVTNADVVLNNGIRFDCQSFGFGKPGVGGYWCPTGESLGGTALGSISVLPNAVKSDSGSWSYLIERDEGGNLVEKLTGADADSFDKEWLMDFTGFDFALRKSEESSNGGDSGTGTAPSEEEVCTTTITGTKNRNADVTLAQIQNGSGLCTPSGTTYSCEIQAPEGSSFRIEFLGPGNQSSERTGLTVCDG